MFAYCNNNPVRYADDGGYLPDDRLMQNAKLYKLGGNFITCGFDNNQNNRPLAVMETESGKNVIIYDDEVVPGTIVEKDPNNIIVFDKRIDTSKEPNPDIQIKNSFKITDKSIQKEVLTAIDSYNTANPVTPAWSRSMPSMIAEWDLHNLAYMYFYKRDHSADCDLDNNDELKGWAYLIWQTSWKITFSLMSIL